MRVNRSLNTRFCTNRIFFFHVSSLDSKLSIYIPLYYSKYTKNSIKENRLFSVFCYSGVKVSINFNEKLNENGGPSWVKFTHLIDYVFVTLLVSLRDVENVDVDICKIINTSSSIKQIILKTQTSVIYRRFRNNLSSVFKCC